MMNNIRLIPSKMNDESAALTNIIMRQPNKQITSIKISFSISHYRQVSETDQPNLDIS